MLATFEDKTRHSAVIPVVWRDVAAHSGSGSSSSSVQVAGFDAGLLGQNGAGVIAAARAGGLRLPERGWERDWARQGARPVVAGRASLPLCTGHLQTDPFAPPTP